MRGTLEQIRDFLVIVLVLGVGSIVGSVILATFFRALREGVR